MINLYMIEKYDKTAYVKSTKERVNALVEKGEAYWVGTDWDEAADTVTHYADRIPDA